MGRARGHPGLRARRPPSRGCALARPRLRERRARGPDEGPSARAARHRLRLRRSHRLAERSRPGRMAVPLPHLALAIVCSLGSPGPGSWPWPANTASVTCVTSSSGRTRALRDRAVQRTPPLALLRSHCHWRAASWSPLLRCGARGSMARRVQPLTRDQWCSWSGRSCRSCSTALHRKQPRYVLPVLPPLAILLGTTLAVACTTPALGVRLRPSPGARPCRPGDRRHRRIPLRARQSWCITLRLTHLMA